MLRAIAFTTCLWLSTFAWGQASNEADPAEKNTPLTEAEKLELARKSGAILRRACVRCHKGEGSESGYAFNVLNTKSLLDEGMLVAEAPGDSEVFNAMFRGRMPPRNRPQLPRPSPEDAETVRRWIAAGAGAIPKPEPRPNISLKAELKSIFNDLLRAPRAEGLNLRYFSITHLHNDTTIDQSQLEITRLALAKALNSLSWEPLAFPRAVNVEKTLFAIDISQLGWGRDHWNAISRAYPYALSYGALEDPEISEIDERIDAIRRDRIPVVVRADWLVSVATKPPLYHQLLFDLHLPKLKERPIHPKNTSNPRSMTDLDLEHFLNVPVKKNIVAGKVARAGFTESGVSGQNRLIERHAMGSGRGFYWKSYDFKSSNRTAILTEFPLGPKFPGNPYNDLAFDHDGGEIIFTLPNGMQGYLLVDATGDRIDAGPIDVVGDSLKTSGNEQIVTGLSCIACHRNGMIESPNDEVRRFSGTVNEARRQVYDLYPENEKFRDWITADSAILQGQMKKLAEKFPVPSISTTVDELPEPVAEVARRYHLEPMTMETVAAELFIDVARLQGGLKSDPILRQLGLRVLLRDGGTIKRAAWESPAEFPLMKLTARQFDYEPK